MKSNYSWLTFLLINPKVHSSSYKYSQNLLSQCIDDIFYFFSSINNKNVHNLTFIFTPFSHIRT